MTSLLAEFIGRNEFEGYSYAYPHKSAYRELTPPVPLGPLWERENAADRFLYVHLPFCEMRCGFCNLFTTIRPNADFLKATLDATLRQSRQLSKRITRPNIGHLAFGGGTPSFVPVQQLRRVFEQLADDWQLDFDAVSSSFETSPATISHENLALLREFSIDRISMGIQSFDQRELGQLGRPQNNEEVVTAIEKIKDANFPITNLDLIYGTDQQTPESWLVSLRRVVEYEPEEIFLYPLYVRDLTGLGRTGKSASQHRRELYLVGRDFLLANGYRQNSMRLFQREDVVSDAQYCCQEEGMVGLGPGARSYTKELHYSSEYAVDAQV